MALENQNTNPMIKIAFDGLNTHVSELFIQNFSSPEMMNCDLDPVTTIRKREGISLLNTLGGGGPKIDLLALLYRMSEARGVIYLQSGDNMQALVAESPTGSFTKIDVPWDTPIMPGTTTAAYTHESGIGPTEGQGTYESAGECLYCTDRGQEPIIMLGGVAATTSAATATTISIDSGTKHVLVTEAGYSTTNGKTFVFGDMSGYPDAGWGEFSFKTYYIEDDLLGDPGNAFYLVDSTFTRATATSEYAAISSVAYETSSGQFVRWPMGVYSETDAVRGYPRVWADPTDVWGGSGFPPGPYDWPAHTHYIGQGLGARMYAYGFRLDPDRVDYSELGGPYNFLKAEPYGINESNTTSAPDVDGGYFYCMKGDGDRVVAVRELMGYTVVFKTMRTVLWTGEHGNWFRVAQEFPVGATNDEAVVKVGNDIYFWSFDGPRRLTPTMQNADLLEGSISSDVIEVAKTINVPLDARIIARHERLKQRVIWHFPSQTSNENDKCLVYYYPTSSDPTGRWSLWDGKYSKMSQHVVFENPSTGLTSIYGGSNEDLNFYLMIAGFADGYTDNPAEGEVGHNPNYPVGPGEIPTAINMKYVTKWFDFDTVTTFKRALTLMALFGDDGPGNVQLSLAWDYSGAWSPVGAPLSGASAVGAALWNASTWNNDADDNKTYWNQGSRSMMTYEAEGLGRIFRFKVEDNSERPCAVSGLVFGPSRKGTR